MASGLRLLRRLNVTVFEQLRDAAFIETEARYFFQQTRCAALTVDHHQKRPQRQAMFARNSLLAAFSGFGENAVCIME
jgi:hypothetical protein